MLGRVSDINLGADTLKALGLNFSKPAYYWVLIEGGDKHIEIIEKAKTAFPSNLSRQDKLSWLFDELRACISSKMPDIIGQKINIKPDSTDALFTHGANTGVSFLAARECGLQIIESTPQSYTPKKFGFDRDMDKYEWLDAEVGQHPPYWDKAMKDAVLAAWSALK
jgi:hypothetical protein